MTGHSALITPTSSSEFHAVCESLRSHHNAMHGQAADVAAALRGILPEVIKARGGGRAGFGGADNRIAARRITKPLQDAAALNQEMARLFVVTWGRYQQYVLNIPKNSPAAARFNVDG